MLTAAALEVLAYEFNSSLGLRGEIGAEHGTLCCRILADPRLDATTIAFWVHYLWVGAAIKSTTVDAIPATCTNILARILVEAHPSLPTDLKLVEELCAEGTTIDFAAPVVFRFLHARSATASIGRSVVALACTLLLIEHHRLSLQRGENPRKAVADVLRVVDLMTIEDTELLQCSSISALFAFLSELTSRKTDILGDVDLLASIMRSSAAVIKAASACTPRIWSISDVICVVARLVFSLVSSSSQACEAAISTARTVSNVEDTGRGMASQRKLAVRDVIRGSIGDNELRSIGDNELSVLHSLLHYIIKVVPAAGRARCLLGVQRAAQSCFEAVAAICRHPSAVEALKREFPALLAA